MDYRLDKRAGKELSALGFGCMRFPSNLGIIDLAATTQLISQALDAGVNYFDTAYLYPGSEEALGRALADLDARDRVLIATKLPHSRARSTADFDKFLSSSLKHLATDRIDYYLLHNMTTFAQWDRLKALGIEDWVAEKKSEGTIHRFGFSFHGTYTEFERLIDAYDWDFVQIQYNYLNENYQAGRAGLELAAGRGLPVVVMEPLLGGKLAAKLPQNVEGVFTEANRELGIGDSPAQWALKWLFDQEAVTVVLSGMNQAAQLADNLAAAETAAGSLSDAQKAAIARAQAAFAEANQIGCTGCAYCMPCPASINIPSCFAAYNESYSLGWFTGMYHYAISIGASGGDIHFASDCEDCGACEAQCPQNLKIRDYLKDVSKRFEFPGMKAGVKLYAKFL